jgi:hypothetical protein
MSSGVKFKSIRVDVLFRRGGPERTTGSVEDRQAASGPNAGIVWRVSVLRAKDGEDGIVRAVFLKWDASPRDVGEAAWRARYRLSVALEMSGIVELSQEEGVQGACRIVDLNGVVRVDFRSFLTNASSSSGRNSSRIVRAPAEKFCQCRAQRLVESMCGSRRVTGYVVAHEGYTFHWQYCFVHQNLSICQWLS